MYINTLVSRATSNDAVFLAAAYVVIMQKFQSELWKEKRKKCASDLSRFSSSYLHDLIMPEDEYSPLKVLVLDPKLEVVRALADMCHSERMPLATSLLRIFRNCTLATINDTG